MILTISGSADLFVPSSTCGAACGPNHSTYKNTTSTTSRYVGNKVVLRYGDGTTSSTTTVTDTVRFGGLAATNQTVGVATAYSVSFRSLPIDGILGLG